MHIIQLLFPEILRKDPHCRLCRLPNPAFPVLAPMDAELPGKGFWQVPGRMLYDRLAHVIQRAFQSLCLELCIDRDRMQMDRHDDIGVDPHAFVSYPILEAVCDDRTGPFINKYRKPFHHSKRHIIEPNASDDALAFHAGSIFSRTNSSAMRRPSVYMPPRTKTFAEQRIASVGTLCVLDELTSCSGL